MLISLSLIWWFLEGLGMRVGGTWEDWFRGQGSYAEDIGMASFSLLLFLLGTFLFLFFLVVCKL